MAGGDGGLILFGGKPDPSKTGKENLEELLGSLEHRCQEGDDPPEPEEKEGDS